MIAALALALSLLTPGIAAGPPQAPPALPFLHPLFTDHCVLQRDVPIPIWGWTEPKARVKVSFLGQSVETSADDKGHWQVKLGPYPAGGPHTLSITGPQAVEVTDILMGDVWICSGQSNMEWPVNASDRKDEEIAAADHPTIRLFTVPKRVALQPESTVNASWEVCSPATVAEFSAVGYFFGRDIERDLKVPIGLIDSSWGGTIAETWIADESVAQIGDFDKELAAIHTLRDNSGKPRVSYEELLATWWRENDPGVGGQTPWFGANLDTADWKTMELPGIWESRGLPNVDGIVWFRREVTLPDAWDGKPATLHLGAVDDFDTTYVNGQAVGHAEQWFAPRSYPIPAGLLKAGKNVIAVRVYDRQGNGGFSGRPESMKLDPSEPGAASIPLAGPWLYQIGAKPSEISSPPEQQGNNNPNRVTVLYNGMIAPLVPFAIKGAIWYQGESNEARGLQYRRVLPALIRDWRGHFGVGDFPFFIVQLANYRKRLDQPPAQSNWAEIREAQYLTTKALPNVQVASAIDIGNADDIHPTNKQEVGRRLALDALATVYGKPIEYSGPTFKSMETHANSIRLTFDHVGDGLMIQNGGTKLEGFAIASKDGKFQWADAVIDGTGVVVSSTEIDLPTMVRYAWADNPACNLANKAGLPAVPFRTDTGKPEE